MPAKRGLLLAAALGGLFASTAVTLSLARLASATPHQLLAGGILAAGTVMLLRVLVVTGADQSGNLPERWRRR